MSRVRSLKQLCLLAFVNLVEKIAEQRDARRYVELSLPDEELQRACIALLSRRGRLTSGSLRLLLSNMRHLDLSNASLSLDLARTLERARLVTHLALRVRLSDALARRLPLMSSLVSLDASYCPRLTTDGLEAVVQACPALEVLSLAYNAHLQHVGAVQHLSALQRLDIRHAGTNQPVEALDGERQWPPRLQQLDGEGSRHVLEGWGALPVSLTQLGWGPGLSLDSLPPGLSVLEVEHWPDDSLPTPPASLRSLILKNCLQLRSLPPLPEGLRRLIVRDCPRLVESPPTHLPSTLAYVALPLVPTCALPATLRVLDLQHCADLSDVVLCRMLAPLTSLVGADFSWCPLLSDAILREFPPSLERLRLYGCPLLTRGALLRLADRYSNLQLECAVD